MKGSLTRIAERATETMRQRADAQRYLNDPVLWVEEYMGLQLWQAQKDILYSIRDNRNTACAAGRGVGKSYVAALAMAWWIDVHPLEKVFVASTAPFASQISTILWNNLRIFHKLSRERYAAGLVDHPLPGYITGGSSGNEWKIDNGIVIGQGRKPPDGKEDAGFAGLHADYLFAVGDEAAGLDAGMIKALGNITTGEKNRLLLIANPVDPTSAMAEIWTKKLSSWNTMHISVLDSPLITKEPGFDVTKAEGLSGQQMVDDIIEEYGMESPEYIINVLGQWAFAMGNNVFPESTLARGARTVVVPREGGFLQIGVDVARGEKDASEVYICYEGDVWETDPDTGRELRATGQTGWKIRHVDDWRGVPLSWSDPLNPGTAQRVDMHARAYNVDVAVVDAAGLGRGVTDALAEIDGPYLTVEWFGSKTADDPRAFVNVRAELFFELAHRMQQGRVDIDEDDRGLIDQLRKIAYEYTDKGQKKIESKDSMRRRGVKSPDKADAVSYAFADVKSILFPEVNGPQTGDHVYVDPDLYDIYSEQYPGRPL